MRTAESNKHFANMFRETTHFKHVVRPKGFWRNRLKRYFGYDVWKQPVCEGCEGWALWHEDAEGNTVGVCLDCGHTTRDPITVEEYYENDYHVDRILRPSAPYVVGRRIVRDPRRLATLYGGDVGLSDTNKRLMAAGRLA